MVNTPHQFKRPLSDGILVAVIIGSVTAICALPSVLLILRGGL